MADEQQLIDAIAALPAQWPQAQRVEQALSRRASSYADDARKLRAAPLADWPEAAAVYEGMASVLAEVAGELRRDRVGGPKGIIDAAHIARQRKWSTETFGPGVRRGVIDHLRKELDEIEADPTDLMEWADVIILGFDGAWRAGYAPQAVIDAVKVKQVRNEERDWPDWRTADPDRAIEHIRGGESS